MRSHLSPLCRKAVDSPLRERNDEFIEGGVLQYEVYFDLFAGAQRLGPRPKDESKQFCQIGKEVIRRARDNHLQEKLTVLAELLHNYGLPLKRLFMARSLLLGVSCVSESLSSYFTDLVGSDSYPRNESHQREKFRMVSKEAVTRLGHVYGRLCMIVF
jgi:hypothetical protein